VLRCKPLSNSYAGTKLQLPVYALAARARFGGLTTPVSAHYWFVRKKRGRIAVDLTAENEQRYGEVISILADGIAAGLFPPRAPDQPDFAWVQCPFATPTARATASCGRTGSASETPPS